MAILHQQYKRRVRIMSEPDEIVGWRVTVTDAETGEEIKNVYRAVITLDARELNAVELFYHEMNEQTDSLSRVLGHPVQRSMKSQFPLVSLDAWEEAYRDNEIDTASR